MLPIREAYEWKHQAIWQRLTQIDQAACFQFVKRMNGNRVVPHKRNGRRKTVLLPIREAYEWKRKVRRVYTTSVGEYLLPIREAYEWKRCSSWKLFVRRAILLPIREAYEWKLAEEWHFCNECNRLASNS